jgi:hypothetical protein
MTPLEIGVAMAWCGVGAVTALVLDEKDKAYDPWTYERFAFAVFCVLCWPWVWVALLVYRHKQ